MKLGDIKAQMSLHIELEKWEEAFALADKNPKLANMVSIPYAQYLTKNDRFEEAIEAYKRAKRPDLSQQILTQLSKNAAVERRFKDAGHFFWLLAVESLKQIKDARKPNEDDREHIKHFEEYNQQAEVYVAFDKVAEFIEEPFKRNSGDTSYKMEIFNVCKFLIGQIGKKPSPLGVPLPSSPPDIQSLHLLLPRPDRGRDPGLQNRPRGTGEPQGKAQRSNFQGHRIPKQWNDQIDIANLRMRAKPFSDSDVCFSICTRCKNMEKVIIEKDICTTCYHKFQRSMISFSQIQIVEFIPRSNLSQAQVSELIRMDAGARLPRKKQQKQANMLEY